MGTSATGAVGLSKVPIAVELAALKGNSPGSLGDRGEPVGAERMILGARLEGEGTCISSVSFALRPIRSGDSTLGDSGWAVTATGDRARGL
jgi:hypothetical protein